MARTTLGKQIQQRARKPIDDDTDERVEFISTGCTLLNLAASQKGKKGGWARGRIVNLVGDGSSGKTLLCLEAAAWAFYNLRNKPSDIFPPIKKLIIVYNNPEGVMDFPLVEMYGQEFVDAVEWTYLETCEEFGRDVHKRIAALKSGECLLYFQDSLDASIPQAAKKRIDEAFKKDKAEEDTYGTEKAKYFSQSFFNRLCGLQQGKDATVFLVSQIREVLNAGPFQKKTKRTGGKALDFYTHQVVWLYTKEKLDKTFRNKKRVYGVKTLAKFDRNKVAKPFREAEFMIRFDYGVDDIQTSLDFLFGNTSKDIRWNDKDYTMIELREFIDKNEREQARLIHMVEKEWFDIEDHVATKFIPKYNK